MADMAATKNVASSAAAIFALILGGRSASFGVARAAEARAPALLIRRCRLSSSSSSFLAFAARKDSDRPLMPRRLSAHRRSSGRASGSAMASTSSSSLVTIAQAIDAHKNGGVFIDGSWHMPVGSSPRNGRSEFASGPRIPRARYFDIDDIAPEKGGPSNPKGLPHMMPSAEMFARAMDAMGIRPSDDLYVYATDGCGFGHRAYWTLSSCGYHDEEKVKLVQGSLKEWKELGGELEEGELAQDEGRLFRMADLDREGAARYACWKGGVSSTVGMDEVLSAVIGEAPNSIIVDARSKGRFQGIDPEPRPGLRRGRMPGSINVPFMSLLDPEDETKFRPMEEVRKTFVDAGIQPLDEGGQGAGREVICTCGSGVTAATLAVSLEACGLRNGGDIRLFDGSWIEWAGDDGMPVETDIL